MVNNLNMIDALNAYNKMGNLQGNYEPEKPDFTQLVESAIKSTQANVVTAEKAVIGSVTGEVSLDELAIAVANAETSLKAVVSIRDRIVSAYQEIIRMPI
jgi:flagellar hook-basal body complex protein FliE